ncbi:outer membrane beta-barrel protein [Coraliomargarita parva]|uniref:outer membrane beta-barrel protein n=1 Tax=Coraliomargarita parva TaxID=3014050 RepID=UPI0022B3CE78|nr:outer membrane beta-barrel protein [Coraliomargarita parva]
MQSSYQILLPLAAATLAMPLSQQAAPLVSIGDNADLFFNGSSSIRWMSNVFRDDENEHEDFIYTLSPGFELNIGRGMSNTNFAIITRYDIIRYDDRDDLNGEEFHIKAVGSYRSSRLDLSGSASFDEEQSSPGESESTKDLDDLIESDNYRASLQGEYRLSPKFSIGSGVHYSDKQYTTYEDRFADRETFTVPVDVYYELTPKVDLSAGYSYSHTSVEEIYYDNGIYIGDYDTASHFFNVGARGMLLPKLNGFFKVGYRLQDSDDSVIGLYNASKQVFPYDKTNRGDNGMLGLDLDLTWNATPKVTVVGRASRDFGVGGEGQNTEVTSFSLNGSYAINSNFSASANAGYTLRDYETDREDDQYRLGARLSYRPNQFWNFSTGYSYVENDSNLSGADYQNHIIDLTASLRY